MSQQAATIMSLPQAFEVVKEMQADGLEWGEGYRPLGRQALAEIIEGRMAEAVDRWLDNLDAGALRDRRNGTSRRCLLSELGDIELNVPRTRHFCPTGVLKSHARRAPEIDRAILAGFVLGLSTRKVGEVLLALLGRPVSAATVSRVARTLDMAVAAFHRRPLKNACKTLMLDGVVLTRKTGAGALRRPVLMALGIRHDGRKEIYPKAVASLRNDLDDLLTCFRYKTLDERKQVRTTNAIEQRFREVRRRTRPMGTFQDRTSMDRILYAVFIHENKSQGISTPLSLTHNS